MNGKQKVVIWVWGALMLFMCICPPFRYRAPNADTYPGAPYSEPFGLYYDILINHERVTDIIYYKLLFAQLILASVIAGLAIYLSRTKRSIAK
jgi:hypothetical protein